MSQDNNSPSDPLGQSNASQDSSSHSPSMVLSIKSLQHQTKPVTISRDASVLDLKLAVQGVFQIECNRQRLIFQGKMMKDGQSLTEYANLDTGKVVHLVVRPPDVQPNPQNDEPRIQSTNTRRTFSRGFPLSRFPFSNGLPMVEGYTFITLDVGDRTTPNLSSFMDGLAGSLNGIRGQDNTRSPTTPASHPRDSATNATNATNATQSTNTSTTSTSTGLPSRHQFEFHLSPRNPLDLGSTTNTSTTNTSTTTSSETRSTSNTQFPASVEVRLMRTMGCMRNVRTILDTPPDQSISGIATTSSTSPEQAREIRARLRSSGSSQTAAVGLVLDDLATLMTDVVPRLQELSEALRAGDGVANSEENMNLYRRVLRTARIIQGMSLINHFLGSVLAAADVSPRRSRTRMFNTNTAATTATATASETATTPSSPHLGQDETTASTATASTDNAITTPAEAESTSSKTTDKEAEPRGTKRQNSELEYDANEADEGSSSQKKGKARECSGTDGGDSSSGGSPC